MKKSEKRVLFVLITALVNQYGVEECQEALREYTINGWSV